MELPGKQEHISLETPAIVVYLYKKVISFCFDECSFDEVAYESHYQPVYFSLH